MLGLACLPGWVGAESALAEPIAEDVHSARTLVRHGQKGAALALLEADRGFDATPTPRSWLIAALWSERHERPKGYRALRALPRGPWRAVLAAILAETPAQALQSLRAAGQGGRQVGPWMAIVEALTHAQLGSEGAARRALQRASVQGAPGFVLCEAGLLRARLRILRGDIAGAERALADAAQANPRDARIAAMRGELARRQGRHGPAVFAVLDAMENAPASIGYARAIADLVRFSPTPLRWARIEARLESLDPRSEQNAEWLALRALLASRVGESARASALYAQALEAGAAPVPVEREYRALLAAEGRYGEMLALLEGAVPPDMRDAPGNAQLRHWQELRAAVAASMVVPGIDADGAPVPVGPAPTASRLAMARSLIALGALGEAESVLAALALEGTSAPMLARVRGHLAFERALGGVLESGYRAALRERRPPSLERVLAQAQDLARRHLAPEDLRAFGDARRGSHSFPFVGSWLNHRFRTTSPLVAHFRRFGRYLVMGQREGAPTEGIVMAIGAYMPRHPIRTLTAQHRHDLAVGYDRTLRGYIDAQGGALGGACLPDGIWLDADSTRFTEAELRKTLHHDPTLLPALREGVELSARGNTRLAVTSSGGAAQRLVARYLERRADGWGSFGTLRAHEFGHVDDLKRYLPSGGGLPRALELIAGHGFSASRVETELERRAQLGAVVLAPDPDLAVAEMLMMLPVVGDDPEVHAGGYRNGLAHMVRYIAANPRRFPGLDPNIRIVHQLDRLSGAQLREAARAALRMKR